MFGNILCGALIASCSFATLGHAASVSFNQSNNWTTGSLSFLGTDGTTVTAEGLLYDSALPDPLFYGNPYIASWSGSSGGIGICSGDAWVNTNTNGLASCNDNHQVDGSGSNEAVVVSFIGKQIDLLSATFAYVGNNDDYELFMQGTSGLNLGLALPNDCFVCTVSNFSVGADSSFAFGAYFWDDDWKLQALEYEVVPTPLPAAGLLLLAGLGGFAFVRRRKPQRS